MYFNIARPEETEKMHHLIKMMKIGNVVILFHAKWCGHCHTLRPEWDSLVNKCRQQNLTRKFALAEVESSSMDKLKELMQQELPIQGFPTIAMYRQGQKLPDYEGERTSDSILHKLKEIFHKTHNMQHNSEPQLPSNHMMQLPHMNNQLSIMPAQIVNSHINKNKPTNNSNKNHKRKNIKKGKKTSKKSKKVTHKNKSKNMM